MKDGFNSLHQSLKRSYDTTLYFKYRVSKWVCNFLCIFKMNINISYGLKNLYILCDIMCEMKISLLYQQTRNVTAISNFWSPNVNESSQNWDPVESHSLMVIAEYLGVMQEVATCNSLRWTREPNLAPDSWEGNGNPLQCSCLENPRDGGAWWAAVYWVAQSRTRLKGLSSSSSSWGVYERN